ncbi:Nif11-like leader peptide family natural product precursor [Cyanobium sp. Alchichica 3B3-8F6]|uniref:Nif11-like leader peptide family natural product precursor n=1 Tax=Cyanobium sp. Alchichica 3B3-8F6 TaxID=2823696 RepID=UPI0028F43904|nr:Nif11-like leader peptide family natural product precursor [Cyanobium sp. Alchichica 3B3-8F6]
MPNVLTKAALWWLPQGLVVTLEQLKHFLARVQRDPALKRQVGDAITADEVALLAQELGFSVSGSDILRFSGQSASGVRVRRIEHPGEYPGRYY